MVPETNLPEQNRQYLLVRSGPVKCALPSAEVLRVVRGLPCHPVPGARPCLLGLAQYGGEPLAVLDLHALVTGGRSRASYKTTVIVGRRYSGGSVLGLAVDEALRVTSLGPVSMGGTDGGNASLIVGSADVDGEMVQIVDTSRLIGDERRQTGVIDG
jgi:chemotaxis signal transduction protein